MRDVWLLLPLQPTATTVFRKHLKGSIAITSELAPSLHSQPSNLHSEQKCPPFQ